MNLLHPALFDDCNLELIGGSPLEDCDIFKKKITLNFDRMFQKPACLTKVLVLMNEEIAAIENPDRQIALENKFIDNCEKCLLFSSIYILSDHLKSINQDDGWLI